MATYAARTEVTVDQTRSDIERELKRYGASAFMYGWDGGAAAIAFDFKSRRVRVTIPLPRRDDFLRNGRGNERAPAEVDSKWEQAVRQRWRAVLLLIKSKLEAVESGLRLFEQEFLADIVLPDNSTIFEWWEQPQIQAAYDDKVMPRLIPGIGETTNGNG